MMDLNKIIRIASNEEDFFRDFYRAAAERASMASAKTLLLRLSSEEKAHKERLQSFDFRSVAQKDGKSLELVKSLMLTPVDEFTKVREILEFALKSESLARRKYSSLASSVDDENAKWLFNLLSVEEKRHEKLLSEELKKFKV